MDDEKPPVPLLMDYLQKINQQFVDSINNNNHSYSIRVTTNSRRKMAAKKAIIQPKTQIQTEESDQTSKNAQIPNNNKSNPQPNSHLPRKHRKTNSNSIQNNKSMIHEPNLPNSKPRINRKKRQTLQHKSLRSQSVSTKNQFLAISTPLSIFSDLHDIPEASKQPKVQERNVKETYQSNFESNDIINSSNSNKQPSLEIKEPEIPKNTGRRRPQISNTNKFTKEENVKIQKESIDVDVKGDQITIIDNKNGISITSNKETIQIENKARKSKNSKAKPKCFTFNLVVDCQPICIAIGDIEGEVNKLVPIIRLIQSNKSLDFIFVGDLFDDVSDSNRTKNKNLQCVKMVSQFFSFSNTEIENSDDLLSAFLEIKFDFAEFSSIKKRVKFIAGNAECDCLYDIQSALMNKKGNFEQTADNKFIFGKGKWKKTFTIDELRLLYNYFSNCYGIIKLTKNIENQPDNFKDTVYFRHAPDTFKSPISKIIQIPQESENNKKPIYITGHCRTFTQRKTSKDEDVFIVDTSPINKKSISKSCNDKRLGLLSFDYRIGFCVEAFALPSVFPIL